MRCPDCNKFVSFNDPEPAMDSDPDITPAFADDKGNTVEADKATRVTFGLNGSVVVTLTCAECGTELKQGEITFECDTETFDIPDDFVLDEDSIEWREGSVDGDSRTEGAGRYAKTFYGFVFSGAVHFDMKPVKGKGASKHGEVSIEHSDHIQASHMDEIC